MVGRNQTDGTDRIQIVGDYFALAAGGTIAVAIIDGASWCIRSPFLYWAKKARNMPGRSAPAHPPRRKLDSLPPSFIIAGSGQRHDRSHRPYRLVAQDIWFSARRQGFDSP